ncbi:MAG: LysR family transcriptional regulator [Gammaproteobacteria bacterium]
MKTPRVSLEHWREFLAVVDYGGYAQAAEHLHRSQSAVSYAVGRLQKQLGVQLFRVEGRKAKLTENGAALLPRARQLLHDAGEVEEFAEALKRDMEPEIRLVVDAAFPNDPLVTALRRFHDRSPETWLQVHEAVLSGASEALEQGLADLAVVVQVSSRLLGEPLLEVEFEAVAHRQHKLHRLRRKLRQQDLKRELQVVVRDSGLQHPRDVGWLGSEHRLTVDSLETAAAALAQGLGFAWLPRHKTAPLIESGTLKSLPLREGRLFQVPLYLVLGPRSRRGPKVREMEELLHAAVREWDGASSGSIASEPLDRRIIPVRPTRV